ncbi:MAG: nuclear transport factor 2 family protein [Phycisphaeraceae bacterium]|nr:nuclear transport factor 2 family protein [Phycisphaeraceae bacterium]
MPCSIHPFAVAALLLMMIAGGCHHAERTTMDVQAESQKIQQIIDQYAVMGGGDPERFRALFWIDDPNLTNVENDRPYLLGPEYVEFLADLVRKEGGGGPVGQRFYDTKIYFLTPDVAYSVSLRDELNIAKTSRVTFVCQKKHGEWRIIHGHFSYVPE